MLEVSEIRKRLLLPIDQARRESAARRARSEAAARAYERFLSDVAGPVVRVFAGALRAEGYTFQVATPVGGLRLESERSREDFVEILLDTTGEPVVLGRVNRGRGGHLVTRERPIREGVAVDALTDEDVLQFLLAEIAPFVER